MPSVLCAAVNAFFEVPLPSMGTKMRLYIKDRKCLEQPKYLRQIIGSGNRGLGHGQMISNGFYPRHIFGQEFDSLAIASLSDFAP
jgi:hypothetical protein